MRSDGRPAIPALIRSRSQLAGNTAHDTEVLDGDLLWEWGRLDRLQPKVLDELHDLRGRLTTRDLGPDHTILNLAEGPAQRSSTLRVFT
jgi:hypothetical protein